MAVAGDLVTNLIVNAKQFGPGLQSARSELKSFTSFARTTLLPLTGITAGVFSVQSSIQAAREQIDAERRLEAAFRASGNAARVSAREVHELAAARQSVTNFSDQVTIASASVLTKFKRIQSEAFTDTIVLAQDLAALTGGDLTASMERLGKAINDPLAGISDLTSLGVQFTQQQLDQIKVLQQSGDLYAAQKIVIDELKNTIGGTAEAMADPLTQMSNLVNNVGENVGVVLLPSLRELNTVMQELLGPATSGRDLFAGIGEVLAWTIRKTNEYRESLAYSIPMLGATVQAATAFGNIYRWMTDETSDASKTTQTDIANLKTEVEGLTTSTPDDPTAFLAKYKHGATELHEELKKIADLVKSGELTASEGEFFTAKAVDQATGIHTRIRAVQDEISLLTGEADEISLELQRMYDKGTPLPLLEDLRQSLETAKQIKEEQEANRVAAAEQTRQQDQERRDQQRERDQRKSEADRYLDSLKTPFERLQDQIARYDSLLKTGDLTQSERDALVARDQREHDQRTQQPASKDDSKPNTALEAGSAGALSLFAKAINGEGTVSEQKQSLQVQRQIERLLARQEERQKKQLQLAERQQLRRPIIAKLG